MNIFVTGGGSGGHTFPAIEIAKEIKQQNSNARVIYVGNKNSIEERLAISEGIDFISINVKRLVGQSKVKKLISLFYLVTSIIHSIFILIRYRPKAVIGVGGFVSAPVIIASLLLNIRRYICEQNLRPGITNYYLAKIANKVFTSFIGSDKYFPKERVLHTGNPVRSNFFALQIKATHEPFSILIAGGSQGAGFLNRNIPLAIKSIYQQCPGLVITHQTGKADFKSVKEDYEGFTSNANVIEFIDDMPKFFSQHNIIISRAGATVCAEIMACGMPAILVPYPHADGHQKDNALSLSKQSAAIMVMQNDNFIDVMAKQILRLYHDQLLREELSQRAKSLATKNAATSIVNTVFKDI